MKIHYISITVFIVSAIVLGFVAFIGDIGENYGTTADLSGLNKTTERLELQQQNAQELSDEITTFKLENPVDFFAIPYKMIKIAWKTLKNIFSGWTTVGIMVEETGEGLTENGVPLPSWIIPTIIGILVTILVAIVAYALFKWKFSDE